MKNLFSLAFFSLFLLISCAGDQESFRISASDSSTNITTTVASKSDSICNPFGGDGSANIQANLYSGDSSIKSFKDIREKNILISQQIFFSSLEIPETDWEKGMISKNGEVLKDQNGNTLLEWFGLELNSSIQLRDDQEEGYYTFASNTDDGFTLEISSQGSTFTTLGNDKITAPNFHCFTSKTGNQTLAFRMNADTLLKMKGTYFQGPRKHIALELYMKKIADLDEASDDVLEINLNDRDCQANKGYSIMKPDNYFLSDAPDC